MTVCDAHRNSGVDPFLTVVMPVHCGERWIVPTLESLAAEVTDDIEVLVIDGSPDEGTAQIVRRFADRVNLELVARPDLGNWRSKTDFAVERARAAHICTLHQDDLWLPGRVAAIRRWIAQAPDATLHLAPTAIIDLNGRNIGTWRCPLPREVPIARDVMLERLLIQNFIAVPTPVFRRDAWLACGGLESRAVVHRRLGYLAQACEPWSGLLSRGGDRRV